jgi:hypothetical protein
MEKLFQLLFNLELHLLWEYHLVTLLSEWLILTELPLLLVIQEMHLVLIQYLLKYTIDPILDHENYSEEKILTLERPALILLMHWELSYLILHSNTKVKDYC